MTIKEIGLTGRVVISNHADVRLQERFGVLDLDAVRTDIERSIRERQYEWRARNIFYIYAAGRCYPVVCTRGIVLVMTVLDERRDVVAA